MQAVCFPILWGQVIMKTLLGNTQRIVQARRALACSQGLSSLLTAVWKQSTEQAPKKAGWVHNPFLSDLKPSWRLAYPSPPSHLAAKTDAAVPADPELAGLPGHTVNP